MGGIRAQTESFRSFTNAYRAKISTFDEHPGGSIFNFRVETTHDASHGDRPLTITDHQHLGVQGALFFIQGDKCFVIAGGSNNNTILCQKIKIKSVQRLAGLHQDKIGDVDNVVYGAQSNR